MKPTLFLPIALVLGACDMTPDFVSIEDVGGAMQLGRYNVVCKGLEMEDEETRGYAAGRLNGLELPQAQECVCKHGIDLEAGTFDPAILNGLGTTNRDEMVSCFLEGLDVPHMEKKLELVVALARTNAPSARTRLQELVFDPSAEGELRARAAGSLSGQGDGDYQAKLLGVLKEDGENLGAVKSAVAKILKTNESPEVSEALLSVSTGEENPLLCTAALSDPAPEVRLAAVKQFHGPRKNEKGTGELACLKKKITTEELDGNVRQAVLDAIKASPRDEVGKVLCNATPWWVRTYVKDKHPDRMVGANILAAQNERDWENTEACLRKAYNAGGYTCHGTQYIAAWASDYIYFNPRVPECPGDL